MAQAHLDFVGYQQNHWVASQHYNTADWSALISFWQAYNIHLANIIERTNPSLLSNTITIDDDGGPYTLEFIMGDYIRHMHHHLAQILPDGPYVE